MRRREKEREREMGKEGGGPLGLSCNVLCIRMGSQQEKAYDKVYSHMLLCVCE